MKPEELGIRNQESGARGQESGVRNQQSPTPLTPESCLLTPGPESCLLTPAPDDPRVIEALEEYTAALRDGRKPSRAELQARYPDITDALGDCLDGLEFIQEAAPRLHESAEPLAGAAPAAEVIHPEGPLGDFRIVREIGRGGMGVVYEAMQISLGRRVALKVLPFAAALDQKQLQRFKNEAQAAAHLHHHNIVPVHFVGCERGVHFYAMQFIEGQTLAAVIKDLRSHAGKDARGARIEDRGSRIEDRKPEGSEECRTIEDRGVRNETSPLHPPSSILYPPSSFFRTVADLGMQAADALEHAHQLGVIHRDIKPANLLVDAGGRLWITDFGLAYCHSQPGLTMTGDLVGTLRYMSPEQALAKRVTVDARTDIYSLGATLYELLTLEPAYNGRNREEVLRQIAFEEPRPPRRLNKAVPAELETIVLKAMGKSPDERYATAQELADDLERYLKDEPIRARRPTVVQRVKKLTRRYKTVVRAAVVVVLLAMTGLALSTVLIWNANENLNTALQRERQNAYFQRIALAEREWSTNDLSRLEQLLDACPADLRDWEWYYLKRLPLEKVFPLKHTATVLCAAFSPDGAWIASGSQDGLVSVWNAASGQKKFEFLAHKEHVRSVAFSPDGRRLATASWDKTAKVWDFDPQRAQGGPNSPLHTLLHPAIVSSVVFSPDGRDLASAGQDAIVRIWNVATAHQSLELCGHTAAIGCLTSSADEHYLASSSGWDATVRMWDWSTGQERHTLPGRNVGFFGVSCSRDGRWLASGSSDGEILIWDARTGQEVRTLRGHVGTVWTTAFSLDGKRLASGGMDETLRLWDVQTGQEIVTLRRHRGSIRSLAFSPDGNRLISASHDKTVRTWDATPLGPETGKGCITLPSHAGSVLGVTFSADGRWLASVGNDGNVRLWDARLARAGGTQLLILGGCKGCKKVAFSHNGRFLATGGGENDRVKALKVWVSNTWQELVALADGDSPVAFSPDDKYLATSISGTDFCIQIRGPTTGQEIRQRLRGHTWQIIDLAFSPKPDVPLLAAACADATVRIWDVMAGKEIVQSPLRHTYGVRCVAFSHDGQFLASGGSDRIVKVWDTHSWRIHREWPDPTGAVQSVAFHPKENRTLAWGSRDGTVKVWHTGTDEPRILHGHRKSVEGVAFSPDGEWIASASMDGTVKLWPVPLVPSPADLK